ncbi:MAG: AAA family ATPase [Chitinispirillaceae bacterium]|nr:AAA family ATPase [Chitinispirillaceae bacterium]
MITRLTIKNFKRLDEASLELGRSVVLIGPNNSGKTSALQAIALWETGLTAWVAKRGYEQKDLKRSGVTINRKDLIAAPVPSAELLWRDLHVRATERNGEGKQHTENILIEIIVEGVIDGRKWECGFEFDYANQESFYCRPARKNRDGTDRYAVPPRAIVEKIKVAFLPPMSGLASIEPRLEPGRLNVLIGEGQTAQVLRNLCWKICEENRPIWNSMVSRIEELFGVTLLEPRYISARGEIEMSYRERSGIALDLSSSGRGLQQTLLLLSYIKANPGTTILLDEPDAHLETLRQRQTYALITEIADTYSCQIIAASHSETVLQEAAERDTVIAFLGKPHRINDRGSQLIKSLNEVGFEDYYLAEEQGWIIYLEGSTDLLILQAFAQSLEHPASRALAAPFVKYLGTNVPEQARRHFRALREAVPDLKGIAVFDRLPQSKLQTSSQLTEVMWKKREIENYFCKKEILLVWARGIVDETSIDLFQQSEQQARIETMEQSIKELEEALKITNKPSPWSDDIKATDDFLDPLFTNYLNKFSLPQNCIRKGSYYELAKLVPREAIDPEIKEKLDAIAWVALGKY